jgi:hypothetical protein
MISIWFSVVFLIVGLYNLDIETDFVEEDWYSTKLLFKIFLQKPKILLHHYENTKNIVFRRLVS